MSTAQFASVLKRRWQAAAVVAGVVAVAAGTQAFVSAPPATASARLLVHAPAAEVTVEEAGSPQVRFAPLSLTDVEARAYSRPVLEAAARELNGGVPPADPEAAAAHLRASVLVAGADAGSHEAVVSATAPDPEAACRRANAVARALVAVTGAEADQSYEGALARARAQSEAAAAGLAAARAEVRAAEGAGGDPEAERGALLQALHDLDARIGTLRAGATEREDEAKGILVWSALEPAPAPAVPLPDGVIVPALRDLAAAVARAESEVADLARASARLGRILALRTDAEKCRREIAEHERRKAALRGELAALGGRVDRFRSARRRSDALERQLEDARTLAGRLAATRARLPRLLEVAALAERAQSAPGLPGWALLLWGLALFAAPVAAAWTHDRLDPRVNGEDEARRLLDLPVLGRVPRASAAAVRAALDGRPDSALAEVYGTIATLLRTALGEAGLKTLGVVSAAAGEGRTVTAFGIACALARKGLQVVLVDADLRCPRIHALAGLGNETGLASLLDAPALRRLEAPDLPLTEHRVPGLWVLPAGPRPENPSLLLESERMHALLVALKARADVIVVDTPALATVGEGLSIATMTDANLIVAGAGVVTRGEVRWLRELLGGVSVNVLGFVLNFAAGRLGARPEPAVPRRWGGLVRRAAAM